MKKLLKPFRLTLLALFVAGSFSVAAQEIHSCVVMPTDVPSTAPAAAPGSNLPGMVQKAVALGREGSNVNNFWNNGSTLRIRFMGGSAFVQNRVKYYAQEWTRHANLNFTYVTSGPADIRISFVRNGSSWSMLGSQSLRAPANRATMNFGWFDDSTPEEEFRRTVLHEFGHALGLLHEHQNPTGGIPWDEEAVYAFYYQTQGWDRNTTYQNVIARQDHSETQYSAYDANSIMHYPVDPRLTGGRHEVGLNSNLSNTDIAFIRRLYPGRSTSAPVTVRTEPAPTRSTETTSRPTRTETRPAPARHSVTVSNALGKAVRSETVELYLNNRQYTFQLQQGRRERQDIRLDLPTGTYNYQVRTASVYNVRQKVWNGRQYVVRQGTKTINGSGSGKISVQSSEQLTLYGRYNQRTKSMEVWLGKEAAAVARK